MGVKRVSDIREEIRLRVIENRMLRIIFGSKRDEVTEGWRKLHNEEMCDLYLHNEKLSDLHSSPSIIKIIKSWRTR
jgi:hypothetical protein